MPVNLSFLDGNDGDTSIDEVNSRMKKQIETLQTELRDKTAKQLQVLARLDDSMRKERDQNLQLKEKVCYHIP